MSRAGRRRGTWLLAMGLAAALVATLWPFAFDPSPRSVAHKWAIAEWELVYETEDGRRVLDRDFVQNLFLLTPVGAGWALIRRPRRSRRVVTEALLVGFAFSVLLELAQLLTPDRVTQLADVWRNTVGCSFAAALTTWAGRAVRTMTRAREAVVRT